MYSGMANNMGLLSPHSKYRLCVLIRAYIIIRSNIEYENGNLIAIYKHILIIIINHIYFIQAIITPLPRMEPV